MRRRSSSVATRVACACWFPRTSWRRRNGGAPADSPENPCRRHRLRHPHRLRATTGRAPPFEGMGSNHGALFLWTLPTPLRAQTTSWAFRTVPSRNETRAGRRDETGDTTPSIGPWRPPAECGVAVTRRTPAAANVLLEAVQTGRLPTLAEHRRAGAGRAHGDGRHGSRHPAGVGPPGRSGSPRHLRGPRHRRRVLPARPRGPAGPRLALRVPAKGKEVINDRAAEVAGS